MNYLIDEVARTLAEAMPRRKVFRYIGGVLGSAFMATIGVRHASGFACNGGSAAPACGGIQSLHCTTTTCCKSSEFCCGSGSTFVCCQSSACCNANAGTCFTT